MVAASVNIYSLQFTAVTCLQCLVAVRATCLVLACLTLPILFMKSNAFDSKMGFIK